ncbi:protein PHLOEM PROTEIN 2-LIKE A1-like [Rhododendron vialii]|uniref:protein PHLOEM PROTEIN 2-LIKE A1-like n=1 Tax=Rhododendron vialii TaxID=182163 RepID=UPI00265F6E01|nr:protein PHLOEM PROTEIN 2-LIKE A1-like [Rhododendron vialii]
MEVNQGEQTREKDSKGKEIAGIRRSGITRPSLNFLAILNDFGIALDTSCPDKLCHQLYSGVFLKPNKLKFFVDEKVNKNCFVLFARELYVCHSQHPQYWQWIEDKDTSGEDIEVAKLLLVYWLDIKGSIQTIDLSPATLYEIVFLVKLIDGHSMTSLKLVIIPQYSKTLTRSESLQGKPLESWFEILVGEFMMSREYSGNMNFGLEQQHVGEAKNGLVVKCAIVRPKK